MKWTDDQQKAIDAKTANVIVSAAAGSGKTQVLSARIAQKIQNPESFIPVDRFLIVTFTKAAAEEMRERIGKTLREKLAVETNKAVRRHLIDQISMLAGAQICTIDSFCYNLVKKYFYKVDLPSDISIGDNTETALLRLEALENTVDAFFCAVEKRRGAALNEQNEELAQIFDEFFKGDDTDNILKGFESLANTCAYDKKDSSFSETADNDKDYTTMISSLQKASQSAAFPDEWLKKVSKEYSGELPFAETVFYKYAVDTWKRVTADCAKMLGDAAEYSQNAQVGYENVLLAEKEAFENYSKITSYDDICQAAAVSPFGKLSGKKKDAPEDAVGSIKSIHDKVKGIFNDKLLVLFEKNATDADTVRKLLYPQIKALCSGAMLLYKLYTQKLFDKGILDFSLCEHLALRIITQDGETLTEAGEEIRDSFDEVYIDEAQDSNPMQHLLFSLISKDKSFMVGDVKQSIYRFRNVNSDLFLQKCEDSSFDEDDLNHKIYLSQNFRSRRNIVDGVNSIFDAVMTREGTKIDYKADHRLVFGTDFMPALEKEPKCTLDLICEKLLSEESVKAQSEHICKRITQMMENGEQIWDKESGTLRPIEYRDITILLRSPSGRAQVFADVMTKNNIPCYYDGGSGLFDTDEVRRVIELLSLIDNRKNDIALAAALRGPNFFFDENELLKIRLASKKSFHESFYEICDGETEVDEALQIKCKDFMEKLDNWSRLSKFVSVERLLEAVYRDTDIYASALAFPDGQMRKNNLELLLEYAHRFEKTSYSGLYKFIDYIEKSKKSSDTATEAKSISEKMNVVRITSIHKSKGLEYPVVFLAMCDKKLEHTSTDKSGFEVSTDGICAMHCFDSLNRVKYSAPMRTALKEMEREQNICEELRILYVALTRARERLFVVANVKDENSFNSMKAEASYEAYPTLVKNCKSYLEIIAIGLGHGGDRCWDVVLHSADDEEETEPEKKTATVRGVESSSFNKEISFEYPYGYAVNLPNKTTVTALKSIDIDTSMGNIELLGKATQKNVKLKKAQLVKKQSGAFFGTAHHKFLQNAEFEIDVAAQKKKLTQKGILTKEESAIIKDEKIQAFIDSRIGKRMKNAVKRYTEEPFVIEEDSSVLGEEYAGEKICVQGTIDCYFEEEDGTIVLVDYKTDSYDDAREAAKKYKTQLYYYAKALSAKYSHRKIEKYLYLLHKNDIIEM